jgi:ferredoxin
MRVHLDSEKCQGHNRCYALAPELFDVDDYSVEQRSTVGYYSTFSWGDTVFATASVVGRTGPKL